MIKIKNFKPRLYQESILNTCISKNCLIVLPTGLGKTKTAILVAAHRLSTYQNSKALFLTPTKPLANQIYKEFIDSLDIEKDKVSLFTGEISPDKRNKIWSNSKIIVSTPQGCLNDIINSNIDIKDVSLLILDEVHRCVGDYDYVFICKQYNKNASYPRIIGLTASPGSDIEKISEVCKNMYAEDIEIRTEDDIDVKPYVQDINIEWIKVELSKEFKEIISILEECLKERFTKLKNFGVITSLNIKSVTKKDLLNLQSQIQGKIARGEKDFTLWRVASLVAETIKIHYALELIETQGISSLYSYLKNMLHESQKTKVKATKNLVKDVNFKFALIKTEKLFNENIEHPKLEKLKKIINGKINENKDIKVIVFNQYRNSASNIEKELSKIKDIKPKLFVGQLKKGDTGLSQKEQSEIIEKFNKGSYNVLISTSIGEEGLDIPKVDTVIFYEAIPSAIRVIQRRGRTARQEKGSLIVLMTKDSRDEAYHWIAFNKEKRMYKILEKLKSKIKIDYNKQGQPKLTSFIDKEKIKIITDYREKGSPVVKELVNLGIEIDIQSLVTADYILSDRVGVEFKTKEDFINSIIDGRLLTQIRELRNNFVNPILIINGEEDIYSIRKIHPNAIRGMIASIVIDYNVPILYTKNFQDAASLLKIVALREQKNIGREVSLRGEKKPLTNSELQEYIIESLPGIGPSLAKSLLKEFKTVRSIINLSEEELQKIEKIGAKKAKEIVRIITEIYDEEE